MDALKKRFPFEPVELARGRGNGPASVVRYCHAVRDAILNGYAAWTENFTPPASAYSLTSS